MSASDLINPGFETGNLDGWEFITLSGTPAPTILTLNPQAGSYNLSNNSVASFNGINLARPSCVSGTQITASLYVRLAQSGTSLGRARLFWYDAGGILISTSDGNPVQKPSSNSERWILSTVNATAPAGTAFVSAGFFTDTVSGSDIRFDSLLWNYVQNRTITLTTPVNGDTFTVGDNIQLRVSTTGTAPAAVSVEYQADAVEFSTIADAPYSLNYSEFTQGTYVIRAVMNLEGGGTLISNSATITVSDTPPPPATMREYKASNSYTYLVADNFSNLASSIPSTALIVGVEIIAEYSLRALIRSKDFDVSPSASTNEVAFDITNGAILEATLLNKDNTSYSIEGATLFGQVPVLRSDFTVVEDGVTGEHRWTIMDAEPDTVTIGGTNQLFGSEPTDLATFLGKSVGLKFYPNLNAKPIYADSGDAAFRFLLNRLRLRVYFDAGSVEYYFASPDKTQVIKGELVSAAVLDGNLRTSDASGVLQLADTLEVMDGSRTWIGDDWTIHSAYPPTDSNQIGEVDVRAVADGIGMSYNGLPSQSSVVNNRSRYEFITENFYGDEALSSIYGVHGLPRAFAYNGDWFYKIYTQPDPVKDSPRHLEAHHQHLTLGYSAGNVDISVAGEPYNFDGAQGASSWAIGDKVVGLLGLSGTILGVFGSKSVWGISGTTVDNFATQVISPKIGAVEYTIADMGYPVYANAYGIYTLSQVQQYGDYLGSPMSQDISPWLRPRLVRKYTSAEEVVVAWPVRSKNQYRLAFNDGYVLSMTMNYGQQNAPTFSTQKYFITEPDTDPVLGIDLLDYPGIIPIAISSELDDSGEERIHIANYRVLQVSPPVGDLVVTYTTGEGSFAVFPYVTGTIPAEAITSGKLLIAKSDYIAGDFDFGYLLLELSGDTWNEISNSLFQQILNNPDVVVWADWEYDIDFNAVPVGAPVGIVDEWRIVYNIISNNGIINEDNVPTPAFQTNFTINITSGSGVGSYSYEYDSDNFNYIPANTPVGVDGDVGSGTFSVEGDPAVYYLSGWFNNVF